MTRPEALRIADMLEAGDNKHLSRAAAELDRLYELALDRQGKLYQLEWASSQEKKTAEQAAAELRRLHAELARCKQVCAATAEGWRQDTALAAPVQEPPRPFSVDEIRALHKKAWPYCDMTTPDYEFARAIERAHGIGGQDD